MQNKPQYHNGSLVNLMSSLAAFNQQSTAYQPLTIFPNLDCQSFDKIVHIVIDGLGYDYLAEYGQDSFLFRHLTGKMTSVFPTTTAAALTSITSGLAPGEHGITGWYMNLEGRKMANPAVILPFLERNTEISLYNHGFLAENVFPHQRLPQNQPGCRALLPVEYKNSTYNNFMLAGANTHYYSNFTDFFARLKTLVTDTQKGFVHCYLPHFDDLFHHEGEKSSNLLALFKNIDGKIADLAAAKNSRTLLVINSDHGLLDIEAENCLNLSNFPKISAALSFPLCGEARMCYCFVKPEFQADFKNIVNYELGEICEVLSRQEALDLNLFGLWQNHPHLAERTGDFLLMLKEGWQLHDFLSKEKIKFHRASHGGLSSKELYIPLIVL